MKCQEEKGIKSSETAEEQPAQADSTIKPEVFPQPIDAKAAALALFTGLLWGGTPVAIRFTTDKLQPVMIAGIRFALASIFMLFWCGVGRETFRIRRHEWWPILLLGVLLFGQITLFNIGVAHSNSSHGSLFINTFIFWVAGIEHFVTRVERLSIRQFCGLVIAGVAAVAVVFVDAGQRANPNVDVPTVYGDLVLLASGLILGIKTVCTRDAVKLVEPGKLILWHDVVGTILFFAWSGLFETTRLTDFTWPVILGLLYQGVIVAGFCFAIQAVQLRRHSASQISVFSAATPLFGIGLGVLFRGDLLSPWLLASSVAVAWGIWLVVAVPEPGKA